MNNSQFRKLLGETPARGASSDSGQATPRRDGGTVPQALGSRMRSSIPMTPRSLSLTGANSFARQLASHNAPQATQRKFKTSKVRRSRLAEGYTDRTQIRTSTTDNDDEDEKAKRVKSLEEMMKIQQIDQATFEKLRDEIVGGDVRSVHLVKGLDFRLLERVRRGEDVVRELGVGVGEGHGDVGRGPKLAESKKEAQEEGDMEAAFDELAGQEITAKTRLEPEMKKGQMAPPVSIPGQKRTRDQVLAEMKAARQAAREQATPSLGSKFKKVGVNRPRSRIERDAKGREVLITVDEHGNEKRKVRKALVGEGDNEVVEGKGHGLLIPDAALAPLGMDVPTVAVPEIEDVDEKMDIFDDVGDDYDPLADLSGSESEAEAEVEAVAEVKAGEEDEDEGEIDNEDGEFHDTTTIIPPLQDKKDSAAMPPPSPISVPRTSSTGLSSTPPTSTTSASTTTTTASRNYFTSTTNPTPPLPSQSQQTPLNDPTILAALKRASALSLANTTDPATATLTEKQKLLLQSNDRDAEDLDLGFGSSRFDDGEDLDEDDRRKLAVWDDGEKGSGGRGDREGGRKERKRGPKKRKGGGDKNSAGDVLRAIERQRGRK